VRTIRRAGADDVETVARLFRAVRRTCLPYLPDLHTADEDLGFFRDHVFAECEVWVAQGEAIDGFIAFRAGWVDDGRAVVVNRNDEVSHIVMFDRFQAR